MIRNIVQVTGPAITLVGVLLSVWGTFLTTRGFYVLEFFDFAKYGLQVTLLALTGHIARANRLIKLVAELSKVNDEDRSQSLVGLLVIFAGFLLQAIGAILWGIDMVWGVHEKGFGNCT